MEYTWYQSSGRNDVNGEQRACGNFSHIQKDIIRTKRDAIVLRPRFFLPKRRRSDSNLATGAECFSPVVKNISVLSATMPSLRNSLSICNQRNTIN